MADKVFRIGQLGCGIVGSAVVRMLEANAREIEMRIGARLEIAKIAVRSLEKQRDIPAAAKKLLVTDPTSVVDDPAIDIVVEVMGGVDPTLGLMLKAIGNKKPVVTANKELLASRGRELFDASDASAVDLYFEAAVAGGIPIIHPLKESLAGERIKKIMGILNGTTNFILTRMTEEGLSFAAALAEAERLGYTELDPTADIEGFDPAAKLAILTSIAFNTRVVSTDVYREGIAGVTAQDITNARKLGYIVKLLAVAEEENGEITARVHPAMIPIDHPLAAVRDNLNAVFVEGENVGELMFYGRGAGGPPTATSVVGDLCDVARNLLTGGRGVSCTCFENKTVRAMEGMVAQYYLLLSVADKPGVLAAVAGAFGENNVSIKSVWQEGLGDQAQLVLITHRAQEGDMRKTLEALKSLDHVTKVASVMRVEGGEE